MKVKIIAALLLVITVWAALANTAWLGREIGLYIQRVDELRLTVEGADELAEDVFADFMKSETYMSITVNHDDLTNIEGLFSEMVGQLKVGDREGAEVTKDRLLDALRHLRRLSGINFDSVV